MDASCMLAMMVTPPGHGQNEGTTVRFGDMQWALHMQSASAIAYEAHNEYMHA